MDNKTILLVDDTVTNLDILIELLDRYDVVDATNGKDAIEIVNNEKIDLILLDIMMPDMDGYEVCERLKANNVTKDIPIIFITAKTDEESIEKAYDIGGADYVTKPFKPKELLSRVKKELQIQDMMKELKLLASTDPMTKLYNRRYFTKISQHYLSLAKRNKEEIALIMLDIDNFKKINDTYGHQVGDEVIISLVDILIDHKRKSDIICRYGGEEFVILLPNTSFEGARTVAENIRFDSENFILELPEGEGVRFTVSLGVSAIDLDKDDPMGVALKNADDALYKAKESGKNRVM